MSTIIKALFIFLGTKSLLFIIIWGFRQLLNWPNGLAGNMVSKEAFWPPPGEEKGSRGEVGILSFLGGPENKLNSLQMLILNEMQ